MHQKQIIKAGLPAEQATKALVMVHGRGGSAQDILGLAGHLNVKDFALWAPQATNHTWYPYSFLAPPAENEPWLSGALDLLAGTVEELQQAGIDAGNIYFTGFSQGACLTLEYVARFAQPYGGVAAFTGGLIGDTLEPGRYTGNFAGTPIFIGTGSPDPHVPTSRVQESEQILGELGAALHVKIYPGMPHTVTQEEIDEANQWVFK